MVCESVPAYAAEKKLGLEEAGRELRYRAAERIRAEQGYDKIALAHQQNDVAETFLFHLFRGSSVRGLASIPVKRGPIIRPLLCCDRAEIEVYLSEKKRSFCTDATNAETEYSRNKIRHKVLAYAKEQINEGAIRHTAEAAAELSALHEFLSAETEALYGQAKEIPDGLEMEISLLKGKHEVLQKNVVHRLIGAAAGSKKDITKEHVAAVLGLCDMQSGRQISLPYGLVAERTFDRLSVKKAVPKPMKAEVEKDIFVEIPGTYPLGPEEGRLAFCRFLYKKSLEIPKNECTKWFDYAKIKGALRIRSKVPGDRIGMLQGSKSLKTLMTEEKIPKEERTRRRLLADERQVIWVPGVRACDNYRVDESTQEILEVRWIGGKGDEE